MSTAARAVLQSNGPSVDRLDFYSTTYSVNMRPRWRPMDPAKKKSGYSMNESGLRDGAPPEEDNTVHPVPELYRQKALASRKLDYDNAKNVSIYKYDYKKRNKPSGKEDFPVHVPIKDDQGGFVVNNLNQYKFEKVPLRKEPVKNPKLLWELRRHNITDAENFGLGPNEWSTTSTAAYRDHSEAHRQETIPKDAVVNYPYPQGYTRNIQGYDPEDRVPSEYYMNNPHPLHPMEEARALTSKRLEHEGFVLGSIARTSWTWPEVSALKEEKPKDVEPTGFSRSFSGKCPFPTNDGTDERKYVHPSVLRRMRTRQPLEYEEVVHGSAARCGTTRSTFTDPLTRATTAPADPSRVNQRYKHSGFHSVDSYRPTEEVPPEAVKYVHPAMKKKAIVRRRIEMEGDSNKGKTMYQSYMNNPNDRPPIATGFPTSLIQQSSGFAKDQTGNPIGHNRAEILAENNHRNKSHPSVKRMQEAKFPIDFGKTPTNIIATHDAALL